MSEPSVGVGEIVDAAASLGFQLTEDEARIYRAGVLEHLRAVESFLESPIEEERPPLLFAERERGHRPTPAEDPHRAWMWKCDIGGSDTGVLAGKTVSFKDHISVAGIPQSFNSKAMEGYVPDFDATVVTRVLEAGGAVVGKNAMDGFMADYPRPTNPLLAGGYVGGSSSGSAVAVAAGEVDISIGGDQGGSIRHPAAVLGIVGLKPTFGLVSHFGVGYGAEQSIDSVGPMSRRVEDVAAALEAIAGSDRYDPRQTRAIPDRLDVLSGLDAGVKGIRVGILEEGFDEPVDDEIRDAVVAAVDVLAGAGAAVKRVSIPEHRDVDTVYNVLAWGGARAIFGTSFAGMWSKTYYPTEVIRRMTRMWATQADLLRPRTKSEHLVAELSRRRHHGAVYAKAQNVRAIFVRAYDAALAEVDVLALPAAAHLPPPPQRPTDRLAALEADLAFVSVHRAATRNLKPANYTGHPSLTVPCANVSGLPVGLQLIGRFQDDPLLLRVAYAYQESAGQERLL